ncbi:MAG TPA: hypothetical protein PKV97_00335 [Thauera aminoaromatica]|nr:hypothetical protein [Thauera aminoaromatica]
MTTTDAKAPIWFRRLSRKLLRHADLYKPSRPRILQVDISATELRIKVWRGIMIELEFLEPHEHNVTYEVTVPIFDEKTQSKAVKIYEAVKKKMRLK